MVDRHGKPEKNNKKDQKVDDETKNGQKASVVEIHCEEKKDQQVATRESVQPTQLNAR